MFIFARLDWNKAHNVPILRPNPRGQEPMTEIRPIKEVPLRPLQFITDLLMEVWWCSSNIIIIWYQEYCVFGRDLFVSTNGGTWITGWFIIEHPLKMDDDWVYPHFRKPPWIVLSSSQALTDPGTTDPSMSSKVSTSSARWSFRSFTSRSKEKRCWTRPRVTRGIELGKYRRISWNFHANFDCRKGITWYYMVVSNNRGTPSHHPDFNGIFPYKPIHLGVPPF